MSEPSGEIDEARIGEKAAREGAISPEQLAECLKIRSRIQDQGLVPPGIGEISVARAWLTKGAAAALYGRLVSAPAPKAAKRSFRKRAAEIERRKVRRAAQFYIFLAVLAAAAALFIEIALL